MPIFYGTGAIMAKISATDIRVGLLIEHDGQLWRVARARHVHVGGRGGAYMQVEAKNLKTGAKNNMRLRTDEKVDNPYVEQRKMRFLYSAGGEDVLMDEENFDQHNIASEVLEARRGFLLPDTVVEVSMHEDAIIGVDLPQSVVLEVTVTEPQAKGSTATTSYKPATMETGITVMVPPFVQSGEKIRVNTESGEYVERAN